jgi:hypothetical protein
MFPRFITHTATLFGDQEPQARFLEWLLNFDQSDWRRRHVADSPGNPMPWEKGDALDAKLLEPFSRIAQLSLEEQKRLQEKGLNVQLPSAHDDDVQFALEVVHRDRTEIIARIEAHSEFFTVTLFKPLLEPFKVATVYEDYGEDLVPGETPNLKNPFHKLYDSLVAKFPHGTFAHFKGVVVGPKAFQPVDSYPVAPKFPPPGENATIGRDLAMHTAMFLRGQKEAFKQGLFKGSDKDVVACYFQRGQVIYVSALGAQGSVNAQDELRYLLIYNDKPLETDGMKLPDDPVADRYRLSRLVHRVNTIGTLRLAALRDLRQLRRASNELRQIESGLEIAAHGQASRSRARKLGGMIGQLDRMIRWYADKGIPLLYRTARARLYSDQMKRLLEDLGADPIPQWQSYNQFVSRRLFAQLEFTARLGNRILDLWALARSRAEAAEVENLRWLKKTAQISALILLPPAVADMLRAQTSWRFRVGVGYDTIRGWLTSIGFDDGSSVRRAWNWLGTYFGTWESEVQEFWVVYSVIFGVWLIFLWFVRRPRE